MKVDIGLYSAFVLNKYLPIERAVWYKTKFASQKLATKFGNHFA